MFLNLFAAFALQPDLAMLRHIFAEALARRQQEFGADHARTAEAARDLGLFLKNQSDDPGSKEALAEALRIDEKVFKHLVVPSRCASGRRLLLQVQ